MRRCYRTDRLLNCCSILVLQSYIFSILVSCLLKSPMRTQTFCPVVFEDDLVIPPCRVAWVIASAHHTNTVDWNYPPDWTSLAFECLDLACLKRCHLPPNAAQARPTQIPVPNCHQQTLKHTKTSPHWRCFVLFSPPNPKGGPGSTVKIHQHEKESTPGLCVWPLRSLGCRGTQPLFQSLCSLWSTRSCPAVRCYILEILTYTITISMTRTNFISSNDMDKKRLSR